MAAAQPRRQATKVPEIRTLCARIKAELGEAARFNSFWDESPDSVGISHPSEPDRLVYVCSYSTGYFVSLELPTAEGSDRPFEAAVDDSDLTLDQVIDVVRRHLGIEA